MKFIQKNIVNIVFALIAILYLFVNYFTTFTGFLGYDDIWYIEDAYRMHNGTYSPYEHHFSWRWTVLIGLYISYFIWGFTDWAIAFPSILIAASAVYVTTLFSKNIFEKIALFCFAVFNFWFLDYSNRSMPDIYMVAFFIYSLYGVYLARQDEFKKGIIWFVIGLLLAFITKGSILLFIPVILCIVIISPLYFWKKFWLPSALFLGAGLITFLLLSWIISGNPLQRFDLIFGNQYYSSCDFGNLPSNFLNDRIFKDLWLDLTIRGVYLGYLIIIPVWIYQLSSKRVRKETSSVFFWNTIAIVALLSCNFMTVSFSAYSPLCADVRHYIFILPLIAVAAVFSLSISNKLKYITLIVSVLLSVFILFVLFSDDWNVSYLYLIFSLISFFILRNKQWKWLSFLLLLIPNFTAFFTTYTESYSVQSKLYQEEILSQTDNTFVITDPILKHTGNMYRLLGNKPNIDFYLYDEYHDSLWQHYDQMYIFNNYHTAFRSFVNTNNRPDFTKYISSQYDEIHFNESVQLYKVNKQKDVNTSISVFNSTNKIDTVNSLYWKKKPWTPYVIENNTNYQVLGKNKFSEGIEIRLDSLIDDLDRYSIKASASVTCKNKVEFQLIMAVVSKDKKEVLEWTEERIHFDLPNHPRVYTIERAFNQLSTNEVFVSFYLQNLGDAPIFIDSLTFEVNQLKHAWVKTN